MTKYALIIEGSWCGNTHIHGLYDDKLQAIMAAKDWLSDQLLETYDRDRYKDCLAEFAESDFDCVENMFVIDEIVI